MLQEYLKPLKYKLNPQSGWKDAFEETFGITLENFYLEFDAFMRKDRDSQIAIIKSAEEWEKGCEWLNEQLPGEIPD